VSDFPTLPADGTTTFPMLLARALQVRGVTHAFGMPGGATLPLLEAFREVGIEFVLVRHEGAAGFMADAAYHVTRAPGVCIATLGPGATNLVSGVTGSLLDRSRVVAITSQIGSAIRDRYTHQIIDHIEIFKPITRRAVHVTGETAGMQLMMTLAALERQAPGPVLIDIPTEMNTAQVPAVDPDWGRPRGLRPVPDVAAAAELLQAAKRPVVVVGCGELSNTAANGARRLQAAADAVGLTTYRGAGMLDEDHPLWGGCFGLSPVVDEAQQALLAEADLMIAVGLDMVELRPNWLPGWPEDLPIISVDAHGQPDLMGDIRARLKGPVRETLDALREAAFGAADVVEPGESGWDDAALAVHRQRWRRPFIDGPDGPGAAIHAVQKGSPDGTRFCLDVGAHRITAAHVLRARIPNQILQSNGFSSMGVGLPAAIACRIVEPDRPVVALTGDAGLWMTLGELGVAQERGLDLVVVYLADATLSLIQLKQERLDLPDTGVTFQNPHVEKLAAAFGGVGVSVRGKRAVEAAVRAAHERGGLTLIEAAIDPAAYRQQM
jgi:acetolactate synthase I/II/III large subunit